MAATKTANPPKKKASGQRKPTAPAPKAARPRLGIYLGTIIFAILLIWLIIGISSGTSGSGNGSTTTTTSPIGKVLTNRKQISVSEAQTQAIFATFSSAARGCHNGQVCIETAANTALVAEGKAANLVHQNYFPTQLTRNDASGYVRVLIELQRAYQGISFSSTTQVAKDISDLGVFVRQATAEAHKALADL